MITKETCPEYSSRPRPKDSGWNWRASLAYQHKEAPPVGMEWITYCTPGANNPARPGRVV